MVKLCVMYVGPADPAASDTYCWGTHLPTVQKWPNIRRIAIAKGTPGNSAEDVKRFPEFRGQITRQIFEVRPYWP